MNERLSDIIPTAVTPVHTIPADLFQAVQCDPLLAAVSLGLLPANSYDDAWDALEESSPGRYQPDEVLQDFLRERWHDAVAGKLAPTPPTNVADVAPHVPARELALREPWMDPFLKALSTARSVWKAAKAAGIHRDTAYAHRSRDASFAAAWRKVDTRAVRRGW